MFTKTIESAIRRIEERSDNFLSLNWDDVGTDGWENSVDGPDWGDTAP